MRKNSFGPHCGLRAALLATTIASALLSVVSFSVIGATLEVPPAAGGEGIQRALDQGGAGGRVNLRRGTYLVHQAITLRRDGQTLRGAGPGTILLLADNANCPVIILGAPMDSAKAPTRGQHLYDLLVDGNCTHQQKEDWQLFPDGAPLKNNGVNVWMADDVVIRNVICRSCRSGGLVSARRTRRLTVRSYEAYNNQFDGLACYQTEASHFSQLNLHDNRAAGISLDLDFNDNVIDGAVLARNNLGI